MYGVDHLPEMVDLANKNVEKNNAQLKEDGRIIFKEGDGRNGLKEFAPYDAIMFGGSVKKFPRIMDQMAIGGRMVTLSTTPINLPSLFLL